MAQQPIRRVLTLTPLGAAFVAITVHTVVVVIIVVVAIACGGVAGGGAAAPFDQPVGDDTSTSLRPNA